jgi:hypothetical protein
MSEGRSWRNIVRPANLARKDVANPRTERSSQLRNSGGNSGRSSLSRLAVFSEGCWETFKDVESDEAEY